jgi:hypothetical protein
VTRAYGTLLALAASLAIAGCGSDEEGDPIPQGVAGAIESQLDAIQSRVDAGSPGACEDIEGDDDSGTFAEIERQIEALPDGVDQDVADALQESVDRLKDLVREECAAIAEETETTPEQTETVTVPEETVPEETVPEETVPEETVPEETVPQDEQQNEGEGQSEDGGTPGGGGGGGSGGVPAPGDDG